MIDIWNVYKETFKLARQYPEGAKFKAIHLARLAIMISFVAIWIILSAFVLILCLIF